MALLVTPFDHITSKIIKAGFRVHDELGNGFLERVYESALCVELAEMGLMVERQKRLEVFYRGQLVGEYIADLVVEGVVVVEIKAVAKVSDEHRAQCVHYLKCLKLDVGMLLNFGNNFEFDRFLSRALLAKLQTT